MTGVTRLLKRLSVKRRYGSYGYVRIHVAVGSSEGKEEKSHCRLGDTKGVALSRSSVPRGYEKIKTGSGRSGSEGGPSGGGVISPLPCSNARGRGKDRGRCRGGMQAERGERDDYRKMALYAHSQV